jgi:hypothetical protein
MRRVDQALAANEMQKRASLFTPLRTTFTQASSSEERVESF